METQWLADPILSQWTWVPGATGVCSSLGTPAVSQPREGAGGSTDAMVQEAQLTCAAALDQG